MQLENDEENDKVSLPSQKDMEDMFSTSLCLSEMDDHEFDSNDEIESLEMSQIICSFSDFHRHQLP